MQCSQLQTDTQRWLQRPSSSSINGVGNECFEKLLKRMRCRGSGVIVSLQVSSAKKCKVLHRSAAASHYPATMQQHLTRGSKQTASLQLVSLHLARLKTQRQHLDSCRPRGRVPCTTVLTVLLSGGTSMHLQSAFLVTGRLTRLQALPAHGTMASVSISSDQDQVRCSGCPAPHLHHHVWHRQAAQRLSCMHSRES